MKIKIKPLTAESIEKVSELDKRFSEPWSKKWYKKRMKKFPSLSRGAYVDEDLVGFIVGKRMKSGINKISRIAVSEEYESKGIGKKLMEQFEKRSGGRRVESRVRSSNLPSYYLHKSLGYSIDPSYCYIYNDKETRVKFFKEL